MDVEGYECKILHQYLSKPHPPYYLPYISVEWRHISNCPFLEEMVKDLYSNHYTPYRMQGNSLKDQVVPDSLERITRDQLLVETSDILWAQKDAPSLFW